ncbi:MAG TPA: late competence development ComFB family protein [Trichocoleus sp.]
MVSVPEFPKRSYVNVMELLVAEEVDKQIKQVSPRLQKYVKRVEVETYALNRLPALYASSEKGWQHQYDKAKHEFKAKIQDAVRKAFAAVQVDPLRQSQPLKVENDGEAGAALQVLRDLLQQPDLSWEGIVGRLRQLLTKESAGSRAAESYSMPKPPRSPESNQHWRPGTYGSEVSWKPKYQPSGKGFDWNDSRYQK